MAFKFLHTPKPKQFEIKTRYYDPKKEEREQRKRELLGLTGETGGESQLRSKMKQKWGHDRRASKRQADFRKMVIFILLALILIYLLFLR